jgi:hypothetical protein
MPGTPLDVHDVVKPLASSAAAEGPEPCTEPQITTIEVSSDVTAER